MSWDRSDFARIVSGFGPDVLPRIAEFDLQEIASMRALLERIDRLDRLERIPQGIELSNGMTLPPVDANEHMAVYIKLPAFQGSLKIVGAPTWLTPRTDYLGPNARLELSGFVPPGARSFDFNITAGGSFKVRQPVNLGIQNVHLGSDGDLWIDLQAGAKFDIVFLASGDPGPVEWRKFDGSVPRGLTWSLSNGDGTATIRGKVGANPRSAGGVLAFAQGGAKIERRIFFNVPLRLGSPMPELIAQKRRPVDPLKLPAVLGGAGSYTWEIASGSRLPRATNLVEATDDSGKTEWRIEGSISADEPVSDRTIQLIIRSPNTWPMHVSLVARIHPTMIRDDINVWSQNTCLRPDDLPRGGFLAALAAIFGGPVAGIAALFAGEAAYDLAIENSGDDNHERSEMVIRQIESQATPPVDSHEFGGFDIVALQEVFDGDNKQQITDAVDASFGNIAGPDASHNLVSSGLLLLIRESIGIAGVSISQQFSNHGFGWDSKANKGFTLTPLDFQGEGMDGTERIWLVNTHTQAGDEMSESQRSEKIAAVAAYLQTMSRIPMSDERAEATAAAYVAAYDPVPVRSCQLQDILTAICEHVDRRHPVLIMGDLNIDGLDLEGPEYNSMLERLSVSDLMRLHSEPTNDTTRNAYAYHWFDGESNPRSQRLDYFLLRQGTEFEIRCELVDVIDDHRPTEHFEDEEWGKGENKRESYLSDHYGIRARLSVVRL